VPTECTINLYHDKEIHRLEQYQLESLNPDAFDLRKKFIGRSSSRIIPKIVNQADLAEINKDADAPALYIDNDTRFINDVFSYIQQINKALREPAFRGESANTFEIFQEFIAPLNSSLSTIFGDDTALSLKIVEFEDVSPSKPAKLIFKKGTLKSIMIY
jgi:hypothetical protein